VITGRGNNSQAGIAQEKAAIRVFHELRRKGVVEAAEHTPGSFVVTVAPIKAMVDAAKGRRDQEAAAYRSPCRPSRRSTWRHA
jgi:hypothetical protein